MNTTTGDAAAAGLVKHILASPNLQDLRGVALPRPDAVEHTIDLLRQVLFPGYFGEGGWTRDNLAERIEFKLRGLRAVLFELVSCCLRYREGLGDMSAGCESCDRQAHENVEALLGRLPDVRDLLAADVHAAFDGDPAARNADETIFSYPGVLAIVVQRVAHELHKLDVPLLPRMMTEWAHGRTGIDIHPGAKLGRGLMIDHGTGVVIGETCEIGQNVKIYQGVTLGAVAPAFGQMLRGQKRHPTIEDDVTIYAGATILGGETTIGKGCVIGGNVFITASVPPQHVVSAETPKLRIRDRRSKPRADSWSGEGI